MCWRDGYDHIAVQQLSSIEIDGVQMRAQKMAELVVSGQQTHGWFDDELTLAPEQAPPLSTLEAQNLKDARRRLGADLVYAGVRLPSSFDLLLTEEVAKLHDALVAIECDGDEFHGPDRWPADMQRQRILERAGWVFWRCFASTWSLRKDDVLAELQARLHAMGIEPLGALERRPLLVESRNWPSIKHAGEASGTAVVDGYGE